MRRVGNLARAAWDAMSPDARLGLIFIPLTWFLYNLFILTDDRGLAHRLWPLGHKVLVILLMLVILVRVAPRDMFGFLVWLGIVGMVCWSLVEMLSCSLYLDPFTGQAIDAWGAGLAKYACTEMIGPATPILPWILFGGAFGYLVVRFVRAIR